jgi:hypothetical protein
MTERQRMAYSEPCARAYDALNGKFRVIQYGLRLHLSTILTVNK